MATKPGRAPAPRPDDSPTPAVEVAPDGARLSAGGVAALARLLRSLRDRAAGRAGTESETLKVCD